MYLICLAATASAATLTVTKTADTNDGVCDADCSLREAVAAAAASGDTIVFASPLFDTSQIVDVNGQIVLNKSLTITGKGANLTNIRNVAAANATTRVFLVSGNPVTLSKMTVSGGRVDRFDPNSGCASDICGAGIQNNGNLTLNETYFTDNRVSGTIINGLRVGGAVSSSQNSVLTILNSTFSDNSVSGPGTNLGGAIYSAGTLVVANSTIANNSLTLTGSGNLFGGGIAREGGTATLFNTTIANNALNGSAAGDSCAGGGVFQSSNFFGDVKALNVIIANNGGNNCQSFGTDYSGTLNSLGNNLIGNTAGATITGTTTGNILNQNPQLAPLGNYGGTMPTLALLPGSSAINAGNNCVTTLTCAGNNPPTALTADQRGKARTGQVDIGAFEMSAANLAVTKTADTNDGLCDADCSLREAVAAANSTVADENIIFNIPANDAGCVNGFCTITLTGGELGIGSLTASGVLIIHNTNGTADNLRLSGNNASRVFNATDANFMLINLTVTGGTTTARGGGILQTRGDLLIFNTVITGNNANSFGGGIYSLNGRLVVLNSTISNNNSTSSGGGFGSEGGFGKLTMINSTVSGNTVVGGSGGAFTIANLDSSLVNSTITNNSASGAGGIYILNLPLSLRNTIVAGNTATFGSPDIGLRLSGSSLISEGNNLIGNSTDTVFPITWQASDRLNQLPRLAPLGFYGGQTPTHAPLSNSPALNNGSNCVISAGCRTGDNTLSALNTDQRGASRVGNVDIGAFEVNNSANGGNYRASLPFGRQGSNYNFVIAPNNGTAAYQVTGGNLPNGVTLNTNLAPNAVVSLGGIPLQSGTFDFSVTTDAGGNSVVTDYRLVIIPMTSANASVSGRVFTNEGNALRNAIVLLTDGNGNTRKVQTGSFGVYRIDELGVGQTYVIQVVSKKFTFAPQTVFLTDNLTDLNFTAQ